MNNELNLILTKLKIVSEEKENGMYLCNKKHSKALLDYITNLQEENEKLSKQIQIMKKYFDLIVDLGFNYDGFNNSESLKALIDELCRYAKLGRTCNITEIIFMDENKYYNILDEEISELKGDE